MTSVSAHDGDRAPGGLATASESSFADWDAWLADVSRRAVADLRETCAGVAECRWGMVSVARIRHAVSAALPILGRFLDMPTEPLPGDWLVPRVQSPGLGASERFGVSPGREARGYFHMPGGQSGHPLSPFHRAGHDDWVQGRPSPFPAGPDGSRPDAPAARRVNAPTRHKLCSRRRISGGGNS